MYKKVTKKGGLKMAEKFKNIRFKVPEKSYKKAKIVAAEKGLLPTGLARLAFFQELETADILKSPKMVKKLENIFDKIVDDLEKVK